MAAGIEGVRSEPKLRLVSQPRMIAYTCLRYHIEATLTHHALHNACRRESSSLPLGVPVSPEGRLTWSSSTLTTHIVYRMKEAHRNVDPSFDTPFFIPSTALRLMSLLDVVFLRVSSEHIQLILLVASTRLLVGTTYILSIPEERRRPFPVWPFALEPPPPHRSPPHHYPPRSLEIDFVDDCPHDHRVRSTIA